MPAVKVKENEPFDVALRRFKRSCEKPAFWPKSVRVSSTRSRLPSAARAAAAVKRHAKKVQREQRRSVRLY